MVLGLSAMPVGQRYQPKRAPMTICLRRCAGDDDVGGVVPVPIGPSAGNEAQEFGAVVPEGVFG